MCETRQSHRVIIIIIIARDRVGPEDVDLARDGGDGGGEGAIERNVVAVVGVEIRIRVWGDWKKVRGGDEGRGEVVGFLVVDGAGGAGKEEFVDTGWAGAVVVVEVGGAVLRGGGDIGVVVVEELGEAGAW